MPSLKISTLIIEARREKRLSQQQLADKIGVHRATIVNYERHDHQKHKIDIIKKIAENTGKPLSYFFPDYENVETHPAPIAEQARSYYKKSGYHSELGHIPVKGQISAAQIIEYNKEDKNWVEDIPLKFFPLKERHSKTAYIIDGNCMKDATPSMPHGSKMVVRRVEKKEKIPSGTIVIMDLGDGLRVCRQLSYKKDSNGKKYIELKIMNYDLHDGPLKLYSKTSKHTIVECAVLVRTEKCTVKEAVVKFTKI